MTEGTPRRPLVRYHGGKWKLAPWIIAQMPVHQVYVEPYGGGGSVMLQKPRVRAEIYNDIDGEIVNLFRVVRDHGEEFLRVLRLTPFAREEFDLSRCAAADSIEQARRTIMRSFMGYGTTMTRVNVTNGELQKTGFRRLRRDSTSTAAEWRNLPEHVARVIDRLQGVVIEKRDACTLMLEHDSPAALFYVDPPYVHSTRQMGQEKGRTGYRHEMTDGDHRKLAEVLHRLKGGVIVSGYPSELYDRELFRGWRRMERPSFTINAKGRTEVLWFRNVGEQVPDLFSHAGG